MENGVAYGAEDSFDEGEYDGLVERLRFRMVLVKENMMA